MESAAEVIRFPSSSNYVNSKRRGREEKRRGREKKSRGEKSEIMGREERKNMGKK
jgi:hypothetical protein